MWEHLEYQHRTESNDPRSEKNMLAVSDSESKSLFNLLLIPEVAQAFTDRHKVQGNISLSLRFIFFLNLMRG